MELSASIRNLSLTTLFGLLALATTVLYIVYAAEWESDQKDETTPSTNEDGEHIGGITGFLYSIGKCVRDFKPSRCIIVFDGVGGSKRRKKIYKDYKGNRVNKTRLRTDLLTACMSVTLLMSEPVDFLPKNKSISEYCLTFLVILLLPCASEYAFL